MPQVGKQFRTLRVDDCKIYELTADDDTTLTYATGIDVPHIKEIGIEPVIEEKTLFGDNRVLDVYTQLTQINWSFQNAAVPLDVLAILEGGTVTQTPESTVGAGDSKTTHAVVVTDKAKWFKLAGNSPATSQVSGAAAGGFQVTLYKCKATKLSYQLKDDYAIVTASGVAVPTLKDGKIKDVVGLEKATALPA